MNMSYLFANIISVIIISIILLSLITGVKNSAESDAQNCRA